MIRKLLPTATVLAMVFFITSGVNAAKVTDRITDFDFRDINYLSCDKNFAKDITNRPDAIKISSNAHSGAASAYYVTFNWNEKQKDDCVMTVGIEPGTLGTFHSFTLLIQSSGTYVIAEIEKPGVYEITKGIKNINMVYVCNFVKHEFAAVNLDKTWLDADGNIFDPGITATFTEGYHLGKNIVEVNGHPVFFAENAIEVFTQVGITVNGADVSEVNFLPEANKVYSIVFTNKEIRIPTDPPQHNKKEITLNQSKYKISSHAQSGNWAEFGLYFYWVENSQKENAYIIITDPSTFFYKYESVSVLIKYANNYENINLLNESSAWIPMPDGSLRYDVYKRDDSNINYATLVSLIEYIN